MAQRSPSSRLRAALPVLALVVAALVALLAAPLRAEVSLTPTRDALLRQSIGAREAGLRYLLDDAQVHDAVRSGELVTVPGSDDYYIHPEARFAVARPEVKVFLERLGAQYHATCGERLVVTSLVRPRDHQPWNSDPLSVHPTGMAIDMRVPGDWSCRRWLESTLLDLEAKGVIEAARERVVPHYHVVVFPAPYRTYLAQAGTPMPDATQGVPGLDALLAKLDGPQAFLAPTGMLAASMASAAAAEAPTMPAVMAAVSRTATARATPAVSRSTRASASRARHTTSSRHGSRVAARHGSRAKAAAAARRYRVRHGDTLWTIARSHGVSVSSIQHANRIGHGIRPGQLLVVPVR